MSRSCARRPDGSETAKARDTLLGRFVALKVLPPESVSDPVRRQRFVDEAKAASALQHPGIVAVHDVVQADGRDVIVMEHVAGETLEQRMGQRALPLGRALRYAEQVADAHADAHAAGIVHRDLKPSNVMITAEDAAKCSTSASPSSRRRPTRATRPRRSAPAARSRTSPGRAGSSAPSPTCRPSRRPARRSTRAATSSPSACWCTRC